MDDFFTPLSKAGIACFMGSTFVGALAYADDVVLLAPFANYWRFAVVTRASSVFRLMLAKQCVCMVAMPNKRRMLLTRLDLCTLRIDEKPIEFVIFALRSFDSIYFK